MVMGLQFDRIFFGPDLCINTDRTLLKRVGTNPVMVIMLNRRARMVLSVFITLAVDVPSGPGAEFFQPLLASATSIAVILFHCSVVSLALVVSSGSGIGWALKSVE